MKHNPFIKLKPTRIAIQAMLAVLLLAFTVVLLAGCVAQNQTIQLDTGDIPPGHGVVFIVVVLHQEPPTPLPSLYLGPEIQVNLEYHAINRIYMKEGWHTLEIGEPGRVTQGDVAYHIESGSVSRFAVINRTGVNPQETDEMQLPGRAFQIVPVTREGMNELMRQSDLPIRPLTPLD